MRFEREELRALSDVGAPVASVQPARARLVELLDSSPAERFVVAPVGCICPRGWGAARDPRCGAHGRA